MWMVAGRGSVAIGGDVCVSGAGAGAAAGFAVGRSVMVLPAISGSSKRGAWSDVFFRICGTRPEAFLSFASC